MILQTYDKFGDAVDIAKFNLNYQGAGHSAAIHSNNRKHIELVGLKLPVSRVLINQSGTGAGGNFGNGMEETVSLGCGSWGNNSVSGNLTYEHMINITRMSYAFENVVVPTPEEIWKL
jgi:succinate-semialdehyde dehydrogenase